MDQIQNIFRRMASARAREHFDMQSCLSAFDRSLEVVKEEMECDDEESGPCVVDDGFPEITFDLLQKSEWAVLARRKWCKSDNIMLLEARALLRGLDVSVSLRGDLSRRCVILTDSMSVCSVVS